MPKTILDRFLKLSALLGSLLLLLFLTTGPVYAADLSIDKTAVPAGNVFDGDVLDDPPDVEDGDTNTIDVTAEELRKVKADRVAKHMEKMREKVKKKVRETDLEVVEITDEEVAQIKKKIETGECRPMESCSKCHKIKAKKK